MRNVLFDARWLRPGMTGVGYFALRLLESLPGSKEGMGIILPAGSPYIRDFAGFRIFETKVDLTNHPLTEFYEQFAIPFLCYRYGYRSFVSFEARVPLFHPGIRTCCFVYDLSFLKIKGSHNLRYSAFLYTTLKLHSRFASRLFTISKTVQGQIAESLGLSESKIKVIYPADSGLARREPMPAPSLQRPYFLAVGATNPRKNLSVLLRGFSLFRQKHPGYLLAVTGDKAWIESRVAETGAKGVINLGFVKEGELRWLYENAQALVFPSLDEGFGIPLVDAAGFDCPILCSDIPVFREVAEDGAVYFDPISSESMAARMEEAGPQSDRKRGNAIAQRFVWEKSAAGFLDEVRNG